jgi:hypothetical protein
VAEVENVPFKVQLSASVYVLLKPELERVNGQLIVVLPDEDKIELEAHTKAEDPDKTVSVPKVIFPNTFNAAFSEIVPA